LRSHCNIFYVRAVWKYAFSKLTRFLRNCTAKSLAFIWKFYRNKKYYTGIFKANQTTIRNPSNFKSINPSNFKSINPSNFRSINPPNAKILSHNQEHYKSENTKSSCILDKRRTSFFSCLFSFERILKCLNTSM